MEVYKREAGEIIRRFREREISRAECVAAFDAAVVRVVKRMKQGDLPSLCFEIVRNYGLIGDFTPRPTPLWPADGDTATLQ